MDNNSASIPAADSRENAGFYGHQKPSIEIPLLQTASADQANMFYAVSNSNGYAYSTDPSTPSTATPTAYSNFFPAYNPYGIPSQFEFNMIFNPFSLAGMDITGEGVPQLDAQTPLFAQNLSPLQSANPAALAAMTRYSNRVNSSASNRKGGRRRREEFDDIDDGNDEDKDKRDKRRLRNKEAAARCRQRRLDLMSTLQQQRDALEMRNNQIQQHYSDLNKVVEKIVASLQTHNCPAAEHLTHTLEVAKQALETSRLTLNSASANSMMAHTSGLHQQHLQQQSLPSMSLHSNSRKRPHNDNESNENKREPMPMTRPSSLSLAGVANSLKEDMSPSCLEDFFSYKSKYSDESPLERPSTLQLGNWGQTPAIVTPSSGMPQISEMLKNVHGEYNMLNAQTFLTPSLPTAMAISAPSAPPQNGDLQNL